MTKFGVWRIVAEAIALVVLAHSSVATGLSVDAVGLALVEHHEPSAPAAAAIALSPDARFLYVAAGDGSGAVVYTRAADGRIAPTSELDPAEIGHPSGARRLQISIDGTRAYLLGDTSLTSFDRDVDTGELFVLGTAYDGVDGVDGLELAHSMAVTAAGDHAYILAYGPRHLPTLAVFSHHGDGPPVLVDAYREGINRVSGLGRPLGGPVVGNDGAQVYLSARLPSGEVGVVTMDRDRSSGQLARPSLVATDAG